MSPTSAAFTDNRTGVMAMLLLAALAVTLLLEAFLLSSPVPKPWPSG